VYQCTPAPAPMGLGPLRSISLTKLFKFSQSISPLKKGDELRLEDKIAEIEDIIIKMEYVKDGDLVLAEHINELNEYASKTLEFCKQAYEKFKEKIGIDLEIESWIAMAETRVGFMRTVEFGDWVLTKDHNLIIDSLKPLELALKKMEEKL